ncbi:MAG: MFS transporter [Gammaproteobacteria bacterium]|nr:MFS transporter [Gammaproteobacteria bacterium]
MKSELDLRSCLSSFAAIYGVGYLSYMLMPLQIGALIESLGLNEAEAGVIATSELIALAVSLFVIAPKIARYSKRQLGMVGVCLVIIGHSLSASSDSYTTLLIYRVLTGIGAGMVLAAGNAVVAASINPQRLFAVVLTVGQLQAACLLFVMPEFTIRWGHSGAYGFLAGWTCLMLFFLTLLPGRQSHAEESHSTIISIDWKILLLPTVLAMMLVGTSDSSLWTFQERIARSLGLEEATIGLVLGAALISGVLGAATSAVIGNRLGKGLPVAISMSWMAMCYLLITVTKNPAIYIAAELSYLFAYGFAIPYLFGINAELDKSGGAMVAANACNLTGNAIGPVCAGYLIVSGGYPAIGIGIAMLTLTAMLMFLMVLKKNAL